MLVAGWIGVFQPAEPGLTLSDGSQFAIRGVSYGTTHYPPPALWNRLLHGLSVAAPQSLARFLPPDRRILDPSPRLVLWVSRTLHGETKGPFFYGHIKWVFCDSAGWEDMPCAYTLLPDPTLLAPFESLGCFPVFIEGFPRRSPILRVRAHLGWAMDSKSNIWEGSLPNPARARVGLEWQPEPLPVHRKLYGHDVSVASVRVRPGKLHDPRGWLGPVATLELECLPANAVRPSWKPAGLTVSDVTGNVRRRAFCYDDVMGVKVDAAARGWSCSWRWGLWSDEPAWEFEIPLEPQSADAFSPGQAWILEDLQLPGKGQVLRMDRELTLAGGSIHLLALVGPNAYEPLREGEDLPSEVVTQWKVEIAALPQEHTLSFFGAVDDQGRRVRVREVPDDPPHRWIHHEPDARSVRFGLAVHPRMLLKFRARPEFLRP